MTKSEKLADQGSDSGLPVTASISVVIPTLNSAKTLGACLESVVSQCKAGDEVIVVDDIGTVDTTREICRTHGVALLVSPAGMAESRNVGERSATGEFVIHFDSDMILLPGTLERIRTELACTQADALVLPENTVGLGYWSRARAIDKASVQDTGVGTAARVIRRSLAQKLGGHAPELEAGEDADLHRRLIRAGASIRMLPGSAILHDEGRISLREAARKKYRYGLTLPKFDRTHGRLYSWTDVRRRLSTGMAIGLRKDPLALPGFVVLKATESIAGLAGSMVGRQSKDDR